MSEIVAEVGGLVDETHVNLGIYGEEVIPEEISALLGCAPTRAHCKGDERQRGLSPWAEGAWILTVEGFAPRGPKELLQELLNRLPDDPKIWEELIARHTVRITFGLFVGAWNRGFDLPPAAVAQLAALRIPVGFDIYADGEEEDGE